MLLWQLTLLLTALALTPREFTGGNYHVRVWLSRYIRWWSGSKIRRVHSLTACVECGVVKVVASSVCTVSDINRDYIFTPVFLEIPRRLIYAVIFASTADWITIIANTNRLIRIDDRGLFHDFSICQAANPPLPLILYFTLIVDSNLK